MRTVIVATILAILLLVTGSIARGDTHSTFQTTRFHSAKNLYFVEVTPSKKATLYRKGRRLERIWSRVWPELPDRVFITNDGRRVVMIDYYYGNNGSPFANVVLFFNEAGDQIAGHALGHVANLSLVHHTTSGAHWYYGALFTPDEETFIVETIVRKCDPTQTIARTPEDTAANDDCWKARPFEELRFSLATGSLISRVDIQTKYIDREKRLLHELELVENEHRPASINLAYTFLEWQIFIKNNDSMLRRKSFTIKRFRSTAEGLEQISLRWHGLRVMPQPVVVSWETMARRSCSP